MTCAYIIICVGGVVSDGAITKISFSGGKARGELLAHPNPNLK